MIEKGGKGKNREFIEDFGNSLVISEILAYKFLKKIARDKILHFHNSSPDFIIGKKGYEVKEIKRDKYSNSKFIVIDSNQFKCLIERKDIEVYYLFINEEGEYKDNPYIIPIKKLEEARKLDDMTIRWQTKIMYKNKILLERITLKQFMDRLDGKEY